MAVTYEWDIETVAYNGGDIVDHNHRDRLHDFGGEELTQPLNQDPIPGTGTYTQLVLVRTTHVGDRLWAYVSEDQKLPKFFSRPEADGKYYETNVPVPKRYRTEFEL